MGGDGQERGHEHGQARGDRNREHFKTAIYFHLGGLQLYPATP